MQMIYCPSCGKQIDGAFCKWCGSAVPTMSPPDDAAVKRKKTENTLLIALGYVCALGSAYYPLPGTLLGLIFGIAALTRRKIGHGILIMMLAVTFPFAGAEIQNETPTSTSNPATEVAAQPAEAPSPQPRHSIGENFSVGYWSYQCNGAAWRPFLVSGYSSIERPDAEFLIVDLTVRNDDRTSSTLPPPKLVDAQGREFDESSKEIFVDGSFETFKQLNPGVSSRGIAVFDAPHGDYMLKVSGGILSGKDALVDLSSERKLESGQEPPQAPPPAEPSARDHESAPSSVGSVLEAAMQGNANAQYNLGSLYYVGKGVPQDYAEAYFWLAVASSRKIEGVSQDELRQDVHDAASHLTPTELSRGSNVCGSGLKNTLQKWSSG